MLTKWEPQMLNTTRKQVIALFSQSKFEKIKTKLMEEAVSNDAMANGFLGYAINLSNYNFGWSRRPSTETLKRVDLQIPEGAVVAVVGPVGSGKSSLVSAILGELEKYGGRVNTKVRIHSISFTLFFRLKPS